METWSFSAHSSYSHACLLLWINMWWDVPNFVWREKNKSDIVWNCITLLMPTAQAAQPIWQATWAISSTIKKNSLTFVLKGYAANSNTQENKQIYNTKLNQNMFVSHCSTALFRKRLTMKEELIQKNLMCVSEPIKTSSSTLNLDPQEIGAVEQTSKWLTGFSTTQH